MKFTININQSVLSDTSLDIIDSAILDYLIVICNSKAKAISSKRVDGWTWINYAKLIKDMPLLRIKSKGALTPRLKKIENEGYIEISQADDKRIFVQLTSKVDNLFLNSVHENEQGVHDCEQGVHENEQGVHENEQEVFTTVNIHKNTNNKYTTKNTNKSSEIEISSPSFTEKDKELTNNLLSEVKKRYPFIKEKTEKQLISNYEEMNRLHRIDGYDYNTIDLVIRFSQYDDFWKKNIRSVDKLRMKFETLLIQAQARIKEYQSHKIIKI